MASDDRVLAELRKWARNAIPWVHLSVLEELTSVRGKKMLDVLARLGQQGLIEREMRVGVRGGAVRAILPESQIDLAPRRRR